MKSRLWMASLVVCGLFVAEDPAAIAVRTRFHGSSAGRLALDTALAVAMIGYNFAASRYVVATASAPHILDAMSTVDQRRAEQVNAIRQPIVRRIRQICRRLNPFDLIKIVGDLLGRSLERATSSTRHRHMYRFASFSADVSAVNLLGVPGAGLAVAAGGHTVSRRQSLRHSVLFVASWFVGIQCIEWLFGQARRFPMFGDAFTTGFGVLGGLFETLTNVRHPIGALFIATVALTVIRYSVQVERTARQIEAADRRNSSFAPADTNEGAVATAAISTRFCPARRQLDHLL
jgi:hypothetical protein